ncbi:MAG: DegT/DnrJ/EryC1/StrS family aminotransferase [Methylicorpusculum sp.]|uniref:DegT/DnrJ/EryC1/StrS family aminotransferase n=1 Tax=Methylicorpusculum sp. TaxID=2713644 RepID=UPI00271686E2|nr:DegT/DnrJ/EryC1/StrS family aminotransferase [Methylicorpusculum sp.]MDO8937995.1 DegT/DnrJ/EryC1/StrS family aminotransferase [Methylicorpusculum sp.]MDO9241205.1 DegT/DnrJ/EryC1/StrS family aminotransferase [Methylicorpusculum sp.]MDP2202800.1 DegT/DnrJ/EryC1/StrS family aminotransferase [Methylicorpusculum sp.]
MIPMVNLKAQYEEIRDEIEQGIAETIANCSFILGPNVQNFEKEAAEYLGVKHAVGVASGTDALHLALLAEGIGAGDEVITTPFTFIATAEAICYVGATPVFVDIDPKTFNIDPDAIEAAITPKTKAIMPVHLFGQPADLSRIQPLCEKHGLKLIEDCAQSFGARVKGRQTGSFGSSAGFSFFPSKNLGAFGDGGLVVTQSDEIAEKLKMYHNHGSKVRYYHDVIGYNSRLDDMQAVILRVKLKRIEQYNAGRRRAAHLYSELMADLPLSTPFEDGLGEHVYHQYTLLCDRRDDVLKTLQDQQIGCAVYYPVPLHKQNVFKDAYAHVKLPVTEQVSATCLSLPICPSLEDKTIEQIVGVIRKTLVG